MKKLYFTLLFCFCFIQFVSAQTLLKEDFETGTFPPANWTLINAGNGNGWLRTDNPALRLPDYSIYSGTKAVVYEYNRDNAANAWMITPALTLMGGQSYGISFYYRVVNFRFPEKLKITVGNQATVAAQATVLWNNDGMENLTNTDYRRGITQFIPGVSGTYYFGFNCYSDKDEDALLLDSIVVRIAPAAVPACASNILPANQSTGSNLSNVLLKWNGTNADGFDLYFDTNNPPTSKLGTFATNQVQVSGLAYSTTYYWYVVPYNAAGYAKGCGVSSVTSFSTKPPPPKPSCTNNITPAANAVNVPAPSATFSVNPVSDATSYDLHIYDEVSSFIIIKTYNSSTFTYDGLQANRIYHWYVVPVNDGGGATGCVSKETIFTTAATLPVMLANFSVTPGTKSNFLNWATATEENNSYFEVQRSGDGVKFDDVATIKTKAINGTSSIPLKYDYEDVQPFPGINYYRLKQVDKDGHENYSIIVKAGNLQTGLQSFRLLYPNPVKDQLRCKLVSSATQKIMLTLTNAQGKTIRVIEKNILPGDNIISLQMSSLKNGLYYLSATFKDGKKFAEKFLKLE